TVHGPDGFVRRFAGTVVRAGQDDVAVPSVTAAAPAPGATTVAVLLANSGRTETSFTLAPNDFAGTTQTAWVAPGGSVTVNWPLDQGRYDLTVTAGTGTRFAQRYAGRLH
ncbi:phospholipase domain-containing protein, partial [Kitasatospora herbaricolor]